MLERCPVMWGQLMLLKVFSQQYYHTAPMDNGRQANKSRLLWAASTKEISWAWECQQGDVGLRWSNIVSAYEESIETEKLFLAIPKHLVYHWKKNLICKFNWLFPLFLLRGKKKGMNSRKNSQMQFLNVAWAFSRHRSWEGGGGDKHTSFSEDVTSLSLWSNFGSTLAFYPMTMLNQYYFYSCLVLV